jgi:predicted nucleic-acid-binding Zn-ribbon protein
MTAMMTRCPKCDSADIFMRESGVGWDPQISVNGVGFGMKATGDWVTYLCTNCGYFENYLTKADWLAKIKADPKKAEWKKAE